VVALEQTEDEVVVRSDDGSAGAPTDTRASFAIGCDGASSFVRGALEIPWLSLGYDQDWLVVDIVLEPEADLPILTMQVCDPARLTTYVCVKDPNRRWEFQLLPGETRAEMLRPERIRELLDDWLPPEHYSVRRAAVYQFHAATAQRWREGRVFLAGDAAHQTPPFLGQGLNTGCRDVVNLAWKLCLVLDRSCGDELLDTYAAERDAHARDLVEWAVAIGKLMEAMAAIEAGKPPADPAAADQSSGYGQGRTAPPLQGGVIMVEQQSEDSSTGHVLRQPTVRTPDGQECRLDELLGAGFAVVARDPEALVLSAASRAFLDRLGARMVSLQGIELVEGDLDRLFVDHDVAIVRPDRYVFGTTDENWSLDALVAALERKLAVRASGGSRS
jgi:3-(3-hydroxy-phenyl)propionate hydroxylase